MVLCVKEQVCFVFHRTGWFWFHIFIRALPSGLKLSGFWKCHKCMWTTQDLATSESHPESDDRTNISYFIIIINKMKISKKLFTGFKNRNRKSFTPSTYSVIAVEFRQDISTFPASRLPLYSILKHLSPPRAQYCFVSLRDSIIKSQKMKSIVFNSFTIRERN